MGSRLARLLGTAVAALAIAGCAEGAVRDIDHTRDLPPEVLETLRKNPWHHVFVEGTNAMPMFFLQYGQLFTEERTPGWRAEWRGVYLSGFLAQRFHDANFDASGKNLSYRIIDTWLNGLAWRWDRVRWRDPSGRERYYLDATALFGAFGYSRVGDDHDVVLLWLPIPLP